MGIRDKIEWKREDGSYSNAPPLDAPIDEKKTLKMESMTRFLGGEHSKNIESILQQAPLSVQKVWNKYADDFVILDSNFSDTAHYHSTDKGVRLNISDVSLDLIGDYGRGEEVARKPYSTLFHELGIIFQPCGSYEKNYQQGSDVVDKFRSSIFLRSVSGVKKGYTLTEMLSFEGQSYIQQTVTTLQQANPTVIVGVREAYNHITNEIWGNLMCLTEAGSDILDGISNGKVLGPFRHTSKNKTTGATLLLELRLLPKCLRRVFKILNPSY